VSGGEAHGRGARVARRVAGSAAAPAGAIGPAAQTPGKVRAAGLSIVSNSTLIVLKVVAGVVTGSIAILTEAVHSAIDLIASVVAYYSIRKADQPADADHPYGHAKVENLASAIEGVLILFGAGIIVFESVRRLVDGALLDSLGFGIAVIGFSGVWNLFVSGYLYRQARIADSPALEADAAHLRTDAMTSFGVLVGLVLVEVTGVDELDPAVALLVAGAILAAGARIVTRSSRVLVDEALPEDELAAVRDAVAGYGAAEVVGFHKLRARRAGANRHVDLHVQFRRGTSLERAHAVAHELTAAIRGRLRGADVLVHIEPEEAADPRAPGAADLRRDATAREGDPPRASP
jgi:cation diffusion facilitator family transporter